MISFVINLKYSSRVLLAPSLVTMKVGFLRRISEIRRISILAGQGIRDLLRSAVCSSLGNENSAFNRKEVFQERVQIFFAWRLWGMKAFKFGQLFMPFRLRKALGSLAPTSPIAFSKRPESSLICVRRTGGSVLT
jgi:hypothetical protein